MMKTPYELLIGRKPNISYFQVFGCKCFIFKKRKHLGKFETRVDEGIFVGYASNFKAYRVFNNSTRVMEETCDVELDESNGSQGDGFCCDDVGKESLREAMKKMTIGDIKPKEDDDSHSIHEDSEGPIRRTREGGSEWEPIKILLEGDGNSNKMNTASNTRLRLTTKVGLAHVATGVLLDLGTNTPPTDPRNAAENPNLESTDPHRSDR
jgi:hypothetical protein